MTKYARLTEADNVGNRTAVDVVEGNPNDLFHPSIAKHFISAPNATVPGSIKNGNTWTHPDAEVLPEPEPIPAPLVQIPVPHFKLRFTPQERVAIKQAATENPYVADWLELTDDPRLEYVEIGDPNVEAAIEMLVQAELLTQERADAILA